MSNPKGCRGRTLAIIAALPFALIFGSLAISHLIQSIYIRTQPPCVIQVSVFDMAGEPLRNATVNLREVGYRIWLPIPFSSLSKVSTARTAQTDGDGRFSAAWREKFLHVEQIVANGRSYQPQRYEDTDERGGIERREEKNHQPWLSRARPRLVSSRVVAQ